MRRWVSLWLSPPLNKAEERELNFERMELLHGSEPLAAAIYSINSIIIVSYLYMSGGNGLVSVMWLACFQYQAFMLLKNWYRHRNKARPKNPPKRLHIRALTNAIIGGGAWGLFFVTSFNNTSGVGHLLLSMLVIGTSAGGITMLFSIPVAAASYALLTLVPPLIYVLFSDFTEYIYVSLITVVFIFYLLISMRNSYLSLVKTVCLRVGFEELAKSEHAANNAKSMFLASMSHELRTPLNAIIGYSQIINEKVFGKIAIPQYEEYILDINRSGEKLLGLVDQILDLSLIETRQTKLEPEPVSMLNIIQSTHNIVENKARAKDIDISYDVDKSIPLLYLDVKKIRQALINLAFNAVKFTPEGGKVVIYATQGDQNDYIIQIKDTGCGIAKKDLDKILTTYGQLDGLSTQVGQGAGFGIPVARALVELHGGKIKLKRGQYKGTIATISLPKDVVQFSGNSSVSIVHNSDDEKAPETADTYIQKAKFY